MLSWTERILTKRLLGDWNRGVYNSQVLEERQDAGPKAGCRQRVVQDLRHMPLLGSRGGVLWGSWAKATLANSNQKEQSFGKLLRRSYLGGTQGEDPGRQGRMLITRAIESHIRNSYFLATLQAVICGTAWGRDKCQSRALSGHLAMQNEGQGRDVME